eukprot:CAMPEP_0118712970 /NCGR_PEP_ID=MMETSP0800-20121206/25197_1 /TAXON_ID=210618 ORGANISM="Striatella unipunctata, Strain CCMP2910" /NCGR_SAMPLE_ID=MMETSP0800 /ASSEMBLY_ACC=CAM_ASM_000638 /LENGTH=84 /DNA_ID=CAMNT_0006618251 /DNA_START=44 /DNA_END=294 /DNA_ORIENTATION=+
MRAFPKQIRERDEMGEDGDLPLHYVCKWPSIQDGTSSDPVVSSRKFMAISALLQEYPEAANINNNWGRMPLIMAIQSGTSWDGG